MQELDTIILLLGILCISVPVNIVIFLVMSFTLIDIYKRIEKRDEIVDDDGEYKETIITGFARTSSEPTTYPICPYCNGHHTKLLFGTALCTSDKNEYSLHYICLDCGKEFDKEF